MCTHTSTTPHRGGDVDLVERLWGQRTNAFMAREAAKDRLPPEVVVDPKDPSSLLVAARKEVKQIHRCTELAAACCSGTSQPHHLVTVAHWARCARARRSGDW